MNGNARFYSRVLKTLEPEIKDKIEKALKIITEREAIVLTMYLGLIEEPKTLKQIADHFHVTRERIWQIKAKALRKLKYPSRKVNKLIPSILIDRNGVLLAKREN
jgi:DNA-directed RNA polymerase sigma subunit (sigma70/sigma32)